MRFLISFLGLCSWTIFCFVSSGPVSAVAEDDIFRSRSKEVGRGVGGNGKIVDGQVLVDDKIVALSDEHFVCATLDWWPPSKCDYGRCSWGSASLLNLDLKNKTLLNAVKAFSALKIRLGGTLQDKVTYQNHKKQNCTGFSKNASEMFGFTHACLTIKRWDELNNFFNRSGAMVVFGLNALTGRTKVSPESAVGSWNSTNAESFIQYTFDMKYHIHGWELGNEINGNGKGIGTNIAAQQYAEDTAVLKNIVDKVYKNSKLKPYVFGPGGFFEWNWFNQYVNQTRKSLDVLTHHIYNLGAGVSEHLVEKILDPSYLDSEADTFKAIQEILNNSKTVAKSWVGEAGGAYNSGRNLVTNAFVFSFWYLDQLGMASFYDTKTYCRQSLIGGNYGLLDTATFVPNPDYYSALLWHRLMGRGVLHARFEGTKKLRVYAHRSKYTKGITLLLLNLESIVTVRVGVAGIGNSVNKFREEYHLTALDGHLDSRTMVLNGKSLKVNSSGEIPELLPMNVNSSEPVKVAPHSIVFVRIHCRLHPCA